MARPFKCLAKVVQFGYGIEMIGNKMSVTHRDAEIQVFDWGIKMLSKKTKKVIRVYNANIKALEELPRLENDIDVEE